MFSLFHTMRRNKKGKMNYCYLCRLIKHQQEGVVMLKTALTHQGRMLKNYFANIGGAVYLSWC